jgi:hypothetical protein
MKRSVTLVLAMLLWAGNSWAVVNGYTFTNSTGIYTPITGGIVLGTISNDDQVFNANITGAPPPVTASGFPIGFFFTYNGIVYDKFAVNTNGWIVLGTGSFTIGGSGTAVNYIPISTAGPAGFVNAISGLGHDLQGQSGSELSFKTEGVAPNRVLTVQWSGYRSFNTTGNNYNFQIERNKVYLWPFYQEYHSQYSPGGDKGRYQCRLSQQDDYRIMGRNIQRYIKHSNLYPVAVSVAARGTYFNLLSRGCPTQLCKHRFTD